MIQCAPGNPNKGAQQLLKLLKDEGYGSIVLRKMNKMLVDDYPDRTVRDFMDDVYIRILEHLQESSVEWWIKSLVRTS